MRLLVAALIAALALTGCKPTAAPDQRAQKHDLPKEDQRGK